VGELIDEHGLFLVSSRVLTAGDILSGRGVASGRRSRAAKVAHPTQIAHRDIASPDRGGVHLSATSALIILWPIAAWQRVPHDFEARPNHTEWISSK